MNNKRSRRRFLKTSGMFAAAGFTLGNSTLGSGAESAADEELRTSPPALPARGDVAPDDTWNLTSLFKTDADWEKTLAELKERVKWFARFEGKLDSPEAVLECFKLEDDFDKDLERVIVYAYLRYSGDLADAKAQDMQDRGGDFGSEARQAVSFIRPELLGVAEENWNRIMADPGLKPYRLKLERIARQRPHTLSKEQERLLALMSEPLETASKAFGLLNNADLKFGTVRDEHGHDVEITTGSFVVLMNSPNRDVRKNAFHKFYAGYKSHENTLSALLGGSIRRDVAVAKARKYPNALEAALFEEEIPRSVYDNLVKTVNAALPNLHRYYELRRRTMKLDAIHMYDTYVPVLSDIKTNYPWEKGVETIAEAMKPLGEEYVRVMTEGLTTRRWCDRYENKGKRSGAFSYGCFSAMPYIMMNYKQAVIDSLFTLAHEAGHSMHSFYSARTQPFAYYDYVTFVAEVASTFNEDLLARHLLERAEDRRMKAWLVNYQIDSIRQTLFRQTMFAQFEQVTHDAAESGRSLTAESLQEMYHELLLAYFGPKFVVDDVLAVECLRVPHFYRAFYVYKYATGISAALALAERVSTGGDAERDRYLKFLAGGSSATPIELLRIAGVDMESPGPVESAMNRFGKLIDQLENLL